MKTTLRVKPKVSWSDVDRERASIEKIKLSRRDRTRARLLAENADKPGRKVIFIDQKPYKRKGRHPDRNHRAEMYLAFWMIAEMRGFPAHTLGEDALARVAVDGQWDALPKELAILIRDDADVKNAFQAFVSAAKRCHSFLRESVNRPVGIKIKRFIAERHREIFAQATSGYFARLRALESSIDRLNDLSVGELESLVDDGDQLSKRIADLSLRVADELKRRDAKKGKQAQDAKWEPVRDFAWKLANNKNYPSRRQAVLAVKNEVIDYARTLGLVMSLTQAETTIDGWLKERGFVSTPSAGKRGTSATQHSTSAS